MTHAEATQVVEDMLLVCQKLKSNIDEAGVLYDIADTHRVSVDKLRMDLYAWLYGPKDVTPALVDLVMGKKPITGQTLYNLMTIAHKLCPAIVFLAPMRLPEGRELPEPELAWCANEWTT